ncbi:MAG: type II toxin-antitoxin system VapC family toxin [Geminicoccaceae bacterium]
MAGLVLDSSIALSWCLPDEQRTDQIQQVVARSGAMAPAHWPLEVANALLMAERRRRISADFRNAALHDLAALPIALDSETSARAWDETLRLAEVHRLTVYDAAYLELAQRSALPLATLDAGLRVAARELGVDVMAG